jgi:Tol biopolymer transport system component
LDPAVFYRSFTVSTTGTILYNREGDGYQLTWFDRQGKVLEQVGRLQHYSSLDLSPTGALVALSLIDSSGNRDLWTLDLTRGSQQRLTREGHGYVGIWSPDSASLAYHRGNLPQLFKCDPYGAGHDEEIYSGQLPVYLNDWSPDGKSLLYTEASSDTSNDLWVLPLNPGGRPQPLLKTQATEGQGKFSPNGKWLAYMSDETGRPEVYVMAFPEGGRKYPVSNRGGGYPRWRRDGKELFYRGLDGKLMAAQVTTTAEGLRFSSPTPLFQLVESQGAFAYPYDISTDGQRILALAPGEATSAPLTVLTGWQAMLQRPVP